MMKRKLSRIIAIICMLLLSGCDWFGFSFEYDELGSKPEYFALQSIAEDYRTTIIEQPKITTKHDYIIAGFRDVKNEHNVWVLLNPRKSPYYKQMPQVNFTLTRKEFEQIQQLEGISYTVISVLETRIDNGRDDGVANKLGTGSD